MDLADRKIVGWSMNNSMGAVSILVAAWKWLNGGKSFNFKNYEDRVKLGHELIKKSHNE